METNENNDAKDIVVPTVSPVYLLVLVEELLSMDSKDVDCDSMEKRVAVVRGSAFLRVARTIMHYRRFARRRRAET